MSVDKVTEMNRDSTGSNTAHYWYAALAFVLLMAAGEAALGTALGSGVLHPARMNQDRTKVLAAVLQRTGAVKEDMAVQAPDGAQLRGWKIRAHSPNGDWILLFHGLSDDRAGGLGHAMILLRHGYGVVMMDSRAHGASGGEMATYGWKERCDTVAVTNALYSQEKVRHLGALGVSMGAAIALQSAAVEPRIQTVIAEDPFADLREVSYDYAGLHYSPALGKSLFRLATIFGMRAIAKDGGFPPDEVSPVRAVAARAFPVLLICGTSDAIIPCRHAMKIYDEARGEKELWVVEGAGHAATLGLAPAEYENRATTFLTKELSAN